MKPSWKRLGLLVAQLQALWGRPTGLRGPSAIKRRVLPTCTVFRSFGRIFGSRARLGSILGPLLDLWKPLGGVVEAYWRLLGTSWGPLGPSSQPLGSSSGVWGSSWKHLDNSFGSRGRSLGGLREAVPRPLGARFGASWGPFWGLLGGLSGASWGPLGGLFGASWGASWGLSGAKWGQVTKVGQDEQSRWQKTL